jgi:hypothetical protein
VDTKGSDTIPLEVGECNAQHVFFLLNVLQDLSKEEVDAYISLYNQLGVHPDRPLQSLNTRILKEYTITIGGHQNPNWEKFPRWTLTPCGKALTGGCAGIDGYCTSGNAYHVDPLTWTLVKPCDIARLWEPKYV